MKYIYHFAAVTVLTGISGFSHASLATSSGVQSFSGSAAVTATGTSTGAGAPLTNATNSNNNALISNVSLGQFDASLGVLTGVELQLNSSRVQAIDGTGFKNNGPGRTAGGSGTSSASLSAPGLDAVFAPNITQIGTGCGLAMGMTGFIQCGWGPQTSATTVTNTTGNVASGNLNDYVGAGAVNAALTTPNLSATATLTTTMGQPSGSTVNYSVAWSGGLEAIYSYALHAAASFNGSSAQTSLTLDFGVIPQFGATPTLGFDIFNLTDSNRTGLDLDAFSGSGDTGVFSTGLAAFSGLAQGASNGFAATMLTDTLGSFRASYLLSLSDADFGASNTWFDQTLTLNLVGVVSPVPEAQTWAMLLAGSGLIGWRLKNQSREEPNMAFA
ncbi:MAG: choice-of-anchor E domain-containing protein [Nitrosomonas sp.]|nr:choice-of-anchor E domain-containing protein [Nitrosomonas sp.]MDP1950983.1 choice-of-anchor E domain-containing protein [Nitrosomonas sp.]